MISFRTDLKIMLDTQPVDFRKSVHTLLIDGLDWTRVTPKIVKRPAGVM